MISVFWSEVYGRWTVAQFGVVKARFPWKDEANFFAFLLRQRGMDALRFWKEEIPT